jgi:uncharacterized repeat protein (TIGR01451 family)
MPRWMRVALGTVGLTFLLAVTPAAAQQVPTGFQEYYVLGQEQHVWNLFARVIQGEGGYTTGSGTNSVVSAVATADGQRIYYDHWEDGLEADILNPTQPTTMILGDGNPANGDACAWTTSPCANDTITAGMDLTFNSNQGITQGGALADACALEGTVNDVKCSVPMNPRMGGPVSVATITRAGAVATVTTTWPHKWVSGNLVTIAGATLAQYNGNFTVTYVTPYTFTYPVAGAPVSPAVGTLTAVDTGAIVSSLVQAGGIATATTAAPHGFSTGVFVTISGATQAGYNGTFSITRTGANTFTYAVPIGTAATATGAIRAFAILRFDGGDHIVTTGGPVSFVHNQDPKCTANCNTSNMTIIGGATEVLSKQTFQNATAYSVPIGENLYQGAGTTTQPFRYSAIDLVAFDDNTSVVINSPGSGVLNLTLNKGEHFTNCYTYNNAARQPCTAGQIDGPTRSVVVSPTIALNAGTKVSTSGPISGLLFAAGDGTFATHFMPLLPDLLHGTDYLIPSPGDNPAACPNPPCAPGSVPEVDYRPTMHYIFNPDTTTSVTVTWTDTGGTGTVTVGPNSTVDYCVATGRTGAAANPCVPANSTVRLTSSRRFWGATIHDHQGVISDWAYAWLATRFLARDYTAAYSPGTRQVARCAGGGDPPVGGCDSNNRAPIWVAATQDNTYVRIDLNGDGIPNFVDINGDGCPDASANTTPTDATCQYTQVGACPVPAAGRCVYQVNTLQTLRVYDYIDMSNTGTRIHATRPVAMAYGQDTDQGHTADETPDTGYVIYPASQTFLDPVLTMAKAASSTSVSQAGGLVTYTLTVRSYDFGPLTDVQAWDLLPSQIVLGDTPYVAGSTLVTYPDLFQSTTDPTVATDPATGRVKLTWDLRRSPPTGYSMNSNETLTIRYSIRIPANAGNPRVLTNEANALGSYGNSVFNPTDTADVVQTNAVLFKASADDGSLQAGDVITYSLYVRNLGAAAENNVIISDAIPTDTTFVAGSITDAGTPFAGTGTFLTASNAVRWGGAGGVTVGAGLGTAVAVNTATHIGNVAYVTTAVAHNWASGVPVTISGATGADAALYNGTFTISVTGATTFTYTMTGVPAANAAGALTATGPYRLTFQARVNTGVPDGTLIRNRAGYESVLTPYFLSNQVQPMVVGPQLQISKTGPTRALAISTITHAAAVATVTTSSNHQLVTGEDVTISGAVQTAYNGTFAVTVLDATHFSYTMASTPPSNATGALAGSAPAIVAPSETLTYYILVRNVGTGAATNLRIDDGLPSNATYIAGSMAYSVDAGVYTSLSDANDADQGTVPVALTVSALARVGTTATATTTTAHGYILGQTVTIAGATGADAGLYNGTFTITGILSGYQFTYTMAGTPVASPATGTISATRPRFVLASLGAGEDVTLRLQVQVNPGSTGFVANQAVVSSTELPPANTNLFINRISTTATATITGRVFLDINRNGTLDAATEPGIAGVDVLVTDSTNAVHTVTTDSNGNYSLAIPTGSTTANVDETDPDFPLGATLTTGNDPQTIVAVAGANATGNVGYMYPATTLSKTSDAVNHQVVPGQTITYTVTLTNNGAASLVNPSITDPLPAGTTFVSGEVTVPTFRVTEYPVTFTTNTAQVALAQALAQNYFVIVQGGDVNGGTDTTPDRNYVAVAGDPFGSGGGTGAAPMLTASGAANRLVLTRGVNVATNWTGVVTVVECLGECGTGTAVAVASIVRTAGPVFTVTANGHGYATGDTVKIMGANQPEYDGTFAITVTGVNTFTYTPTADPGVSATFAIPLTASRISLRASGITRVGTLATITTASNHIYSTGDSVTISGATGADAALYNGTFTITVTGANTFTYAMAGTPAAAAAGTIQVERNPLAGFKLVDVRRVAHANGVLTASPTTQQPWTDLGRIVPFGGPNAAGCFTASANVAQAQACHILYTVSGTNTLTWTRAAGPAAATSVVHAVQWGREWTINASNVTGTAGGAGADIVTEYDNSSAAPFPLVARQNTWVFATGHTTAAETGSSAEGSLVALGDGVNQNAYESFVAVGQEVAGNTKTFRVFTLTHPSLHVDHYHRASAAGGGGDVAETLTLANPFTYAPSNRMALVSNGSTEVANTNWARTMLAAYYLNSTQINLYRPRNGFAFSAWVQGINFTQIGRSWGASSDPTGGTHELVPTGITLAPGQTLVVNYKVQVGSGVADGTLITNTASGPGGTTASVTDTVRRAGVVLEYDNAAFAMYNATTATTVSYRHVVCNTGANPDSYDLTASSEQGWRVDLIDPATGATIATDSNGDGIWDGSVTINTGTLAASTSGINPCSDPKEYLFRVTVPAGTAAGTEQTIRLLARSRLDRNTTDDARDETTVLPVAAFGTVTLLPDNSGVITCGASDYEVYTHRVVNLTGAAETFDLGVETTINNVVSATWTAIIYYDADGNGVYSAGDIAITNTSQIPNGSSQTIFVVVKCPTGTAAGVKAVTQVSAFSRSNARLADFASDTSTVVVPSAHDLSGGGTRDVFSPDTAYFPGTLTNYTTAAASFQLTISAASFYGLDGLNHGSQLWIDTNTDGTPDLRIAEDTDGNGTWDYVDGSYSSGGLPTVSVPAGGTLAYELRRPIASNQSAMVDYATLTATRVGATSGVSDSVTATVILPLVSRATLMGLRVDAAAGVVEFATSYQRGTLAFEVYELADPRDPTKKTLVSDGPVPAPSPDSVLPTLYEVRTRPITEPYLLVEEIEVKGTRRAMGPFLVADRRLAGSLERLETRLGDDPEALDRSRPGVRRVTTQGLRHLLPLSQQAGARSQREMLASMGSLRTLGTSVSTSEPAQNLAVSIFSGNASSLGRPVPSQAAGGSGTPQQAVRVDVHGSGPVTVPLTQLEAAGLTLARTAGLRLTSFGRGVPFVRTTTPSGAPAVLFQASELGADYFPGNAYVFSVGRPPAAPSVTLTRSAVPRPPGVTRIERNAFYDARIPLGADPWIWDILSYGAWPSALWDPRAGDFDLPGLPSNAAGDVRVRIRLLGATDHEHSFEARINGVSVGSVSFTGEMVSGDLVGAVPATALKTSGNQLTIDYFPASVPDGLPPDWAVGALDFLDLELPPAANAVVDRIEAYDPGLPALAGVQYLVVTHPLFRSQADRLAALRKARGLRSAVVEVDSAYDAYSAGVVEPNAIKALVRAASKASQALRYVVILGDDTCDPQDFQHLGAVSYVPSLLSWDGEFGRMASENLYVDQNGDGLPELAIGRLPAQTLDEARVLVDKIAAYSPAGASAPQIFASDNSGELDSRFQQEAERMAATLPAGTPIVPVNIGAGIQAARATLKAAWQAGAADVHYFGHGGWDRWADEDLLSTDDAPVLTTSRAPLVFTWGCEVNWYNNFFGPSLGEALVLAPGAGATASFGPSGVTSPTAQRNLYEQLFARAAGPGAAKLTLGELIRQSKVAALKRDARSRPAVEGWNLLGDPALPLVAAGR